MNVDHQPSIPKTASQSTLLQAPPREVQEQLELNGVDDAQLKLAVCTDIGLLGQYRDNWLAVTPERLLVVADGAAPEIALSLRFSEASEFRTQTRVGSGLLQAKVNGTYVDVLRYSNRRALRFEKITTKLNRHLQGEPIEIHPEDEVDPRRCPKCGTPAWNDQRPVDSLLNRRRRTSASRRTSSQRP